MSEYGYYPGCSLTGSARKLDRGVRKLFKMLGHELKEIPDWNCCGALEYGDRNELMDFSKANLKKAHALSGEIMAPCPACFKNLKEANVDSRRAVLHPLELFNEALISSLPAKRDLKGQVFTPYYGCVLLRPEATAIMDKDVMEKVLSAFGGEIEGEKMKDRCCGGGQFFANKWATEKLSRLILDKTKGTLVVFCPLCQMALKTFSDSGRKVVYFTDVVLYVLGEGTTL